MTKSTMSIQGGAQCERWVYPLGEDIPDSPVLGGRGGEISPRYLNPPVLTSSLVFRHHISGSRLLVSLNLTCHGLSP